MPHSFGRVISSLKSSLMDRFCEYSRIELVTVFLIGSQFGLYFLGIGPVVSVVAAVVLFVFWLIDFAVEKEISLAPLNMIWGVASILLLFITVVNYYQSGSGGTYMLRWVFSFFAAAVCLMVGGQIRPSLLQFASRILGVQVLLFTCVFMLLAVWGMDFHYRSWVPNWRNVLPEEYFFVHSMEMGTDTFPRAVGFTPYATYGGFVGVMGLLSSGFQSDSKLSLLGSLGWAALVLASFARTSYIACIIALSILFFLVVPFRLRLLSVAIGCFLVAVWMGDVMHLFREGYYFVENLRPDSSAVRKELGFLGYGEWRYGGELLTGRGSTIEAGSIVKHMPVGTHGTLYSTLLIRGLLGLLIVLAGAWLILVEVLRYPSGAVRNAVVACLGALAISAISENIEALCQYGWFAFLFIGTLTHKQHETYFS